MHYSSNDMLSYNKTFNFAVTERIGGKSFDWKDRAISGYLKRKVQKIWVRWEKTEIDTDFREKFFTDIQFKYPDVQFKVKETESGATAFLNGDPFIYFIGLKTSWKHKSIPYTNVDYIVYDEFIINYNIADTRKGEVFKFMELYNTVARPITIGFDEVGKPIKHDPKTRCIFLGNSITSVNVFFSYFKLKLDKTKRFSLSDNAVIDCWHSVELKEYIKSTKLGQSISDTKYGDYAMSNEFYLDKNEFIENKTNSSQYLVGFSYNNQNIGCWICYKTNRIYVNNQVDRQKGLVAVTLEDHTINTLLLMSYKRTFTYKQIKHAFDMSYIRYDSQTTLNLFTEIIHTL